MPLREGSRQLCSGRPQTGHPFDGSLMPLRANVAQGSDHNLRRGRFLNMLAPEVGAPPTCGQRAEGMLNGIPQSIKSQFTHVLRVSDHLAHAVLAARERLTDGLKSRRRLLQHITE